MIRKFIQIFFCLLSIGLLVLAFVFYRENENLKANNSGIINDIKERQNQVDELLDEQKKLNEELEEIINQQEEIKKENALWQRHNQELEKALAD